MKNLLSYLLFFAGITIILSNPIAPPTIQGFMQGGSILWIFNLTVMSAVLCINMLLYKYNKVRAEQKVEARRNSNVAFALYVAYILGNFTTEVIPSMLNNIAGFIFLWSAVEAYRFKRTTDRLQYFDQIRKYNDHLPVLFTHSTITKIGGREFTLESLRVALRDYSQSSEEILYHAKCLLLAVGVKIE